MNPQDLTEDIEEKESLSSFQTKNMLTVSGFEEAFKEFATAGIQNSQVTEVVPCDVASSTCKTIPADKKMDVSATQVRTVIKPSHLFIGLRWKTYLLY